MKKRNTIILIILLFCGVLSLADESITPLVPIVLPQSPNVAEFPLYGNIPVDYYTGALNLSIPIFEIDVDGCKIPIAVSYHATGIKVSQHASNVGLGWQLNCGGIITADCYGFGDFECWNDGYICNRFANGIPNDSLFVYYSMTNKGVDITKMDTRPDIYHYSFCENSGELFFPPHEPGHPVLVKSDKYLDISYIRDLQTWTIYDGNGNRFHFGNKPHVSMNASFFGPSSEAESAQSVVDDPAIGGYSWDYHSVNAWPLDTIRTAHGRNIIFKYRRESILTPMMPHEDIRITHIEEFGECDVPLRNQYYSHDAANIIQTVPTEISFPNGKVTFYSSSRSDIWRGVYFTYDDVDDPTKVDSILVTDGMGNVIKRAVFYYHYAGNTSSPNTCRLILDSIGGLEERVYKFTYYNTYLPKKNSKQIDMWGFYNASTAQSIWSTTWNNSKTAEGTLIPSMIIDNRLFHGRDRQCNIQTITNAALKEITYPTGGRSVFEYEPHTFLSETTDVEIIGESITSNTCLILNVNLSQGNNVTTMTPARIDTIMINEYDNIDVHVSSEAVFEGPSSPINIAELIITNLNGVIVYQNNIMLYNERHDYDFHPTLTSGIYIFSLTYNGMPIPLPNPGYNVTSESVFVCGNIILQRHSPNGNKIHMGGGLRIKSITNYDISNDIIQQKTYNYQLNDTLSSGKLFVRPRFAHMFEQEYRHAIFPTIVPCGYFIRSCVSSAMLVPPQPMITSNVIGYSKVTETITPQSVYGKTEYVFDNVGANSPSGFPNFMAVPSNRNGTLLKRNTYKSDNELQQKTEYVYSSYSEKQIYGLHTIKLFPELYYQAGTQQVGNVQMDKYAIYSTTIRNTTIKTTDFLNGDSLIRHEVYVYDSINHLPMHTYTFTAGDTIESAIAYSSGNTSSDALMLQAHHLYNTPLQQKSYHNGELTMTTDYIYEENAAMALLNEVRQIRPDNNSDSMKVYSIKSFDSYGNPTCIESSTHVPTAYLWGCNSMYPIVEVVGATYQQIVSTMSPGFVNMLAGACNVSISMLKSVYNALSSSIPHGDIHIYSYLPYVGITTEIDSRGVVYSYEYNEHNRLIAKYIEKETQRYVVEKYDYHFYER